MKPILLKQVKKGEFFALTNDVKYNEDGEVLSKYVYVRDAYDRDSKKYEVYKFDDVCNYRFMNGTRIVYVDFRF
jgi:hypothetical protein